MKPSERITRYRLELPSSSGGEFGDDIEEVGPEAAHNAVFTRGNLVPWPLGRHSWFDVAQTELLSPLDEGPHRLPRLGLHHSLGEHHGSPAEPSPVG